MKDFLLFTIYAPWGSWGDITVGETRGSWDRPSRSAVLGILGAALGLVREDQAAQDALDVAYGVAVRVDLPGNALIDYHTAQTVPAATVRRVGAATRAAHLSAGEPETILSRRTYRQGGLYTVALWEIADGRWGLIELAEALRRPGFVLYAGRKANVLGAPTAPQVVRGESLAAGLETRPAGVRGIPDDLLRGGKPWGREVSHDSCDGFSSGLIPLRHEVRRDVPVHRTRWQFRERRVEVGLLASPEPAELRI